MINVYDFDNTIYHGDCSVHFWVYCMKQKPLICLLIPIQLLNFILIKLHIISDKSLFFSFLRFFKNQNIINNFWDKHEKNICQWYMEQRDPSDVIISASPDFLIEEMAKRLGVHCIASKVSFETGKCLSPNCKGEQKVIRFKELYPETQIRNCYGDSMSDRFIMELAEKAHFVKNMSTDDVQINQKVER